MQTNIGETNSSIIKHIYKMQNAIASDTNAKMNWFFQQPKDNSVKIENIQDWFIEHVGNIDTNNKSIDSIREQITSSENDGIITDIVNALNASEINEKFKSLIRVAAVSMIIENEEDSKYGWSHCLTIPHSLWSLKQFCNDELIALKAAATYVGSLRHIMAKTKISIDSLDEYFETDETSIFAEHYVRITDIISKASTMQDAHLVKYVYTCFDCMKRDPQYSKLYLASAARLLELWVNETATN